MLICEEVSVQEYRTFAEAGATLGRFIADGYDAEHRHALLDFRLPVVDEAARLVEARMMGRRA
jgi:hypothetical protein